MYKGTGVAIYHTEAQRTQRIRDINYKSLIHASVKDRSPIITHYALRIAH